MPIKMTIPFRLYGGFGVVIVLGAALAGYGYWQLSAIDVDATRMSNYATNAVRVLKTDTLLEALRRTKTKYQLDVDAQAVADFREKLPEAVKLMQIAADAALSPDRKKAYQAMGQAITDHGVAVEKFFAEVDAVAAGKTAWFAAGDVLTKADHDLIDPLMADSDPQLVLAASRTDQSVLALRLAGLRFLASADPKWFDTMHKNAEKAEATIAELLASAPEDLKAKAGTASDAVHGYVAAADAQARAMQTVVDHNQVLKQQTLDMQTNLDTVRDSLLKDFAAADEQATSAIDSTKMWQSTLALVAAALGIGFAVIIGRGISRPLHGMTAAMKLLAAGSVDVVVPHRNRGDEIGVMAGAVDVFKQNAVEKLALEERQRREQEARTRRQEEVDQLVGFFGQSVSGVFATVSEASVGIAKTSTSLQDSAADTGNQARQVMGDIEQTSATIQSVAAASQELSASIDEIGRQASESSRISTAAMDQSDDVVKRVQELSAAAEQIGTVVDLINNIAGQTNLLALNATIEAARAGESGKGFAVVASEVKILAQQTGKATEDIGSHVSAIQSVAARTAEAIKGIAQTVKQVSEIAVAIASAVTEQSAATQEIARSFEQVSETTTNVTRSMERVSSSVGHNTESATAVKTIAEGLSSEADALGVEVRDFLGALADLSKSEEFRTYDVNLAAAIMVEGGTITGALTKASPGFVVFAGQLSVPPGTMVEIRVAELDRPLKARFVESKDGSAYLQLPLNHEHLTYMAQVLGKFQKLAA